MLYLDLDCTACSAFLDIAVSFAQVNLRAPPYLIRGVALDLSLFSQLFILLWPDIFMLVCAGRMQDNEPLMRALSNLINLNEPDLTLFVGEALVGNDAVDQLTKFNQRLADLAKTPNAQMIQGLVLTKMDTIDDKVCSCIELTADIC